MITVTGLTYNNGSASAWPWKCIRCDTVAELQALPTVALVPGMCAYVAEDGVHRIVGGDMTWGVDPNPPVAGGTGPTGPAGPQGIQGVAGAAGAQGQQGLQGIPGNDGAPGTPGSQGPQGIQGIQGPQGDPATNLVQSVAGRTGAVVLAKADVGLGSVDNTADTAKPVSSSQQIALDGKSATGHNHDASYEAVGSVATHAAAADPHTGYQKESEKATANGYASLGADGKVPAGQLPAAGSDPWTYLRLASDFTTSSATAVDVTGLGFAPAANTRYEFEAQLMLRTATATVNPRTGFAWPTGMTDGVASIDQSQTATTQLMARGSIAAALLIAVGGLTNTTASWPCTVLGVAVAGATPSGNIRLQLASETAGTVVRVVAGSFLKYRTVP